MTEDKMVEWQHQLNGHEFEQASGDGEGQGSLACCSPWGHKESDTTEQLNNSVVAVLLLSHIQLFCDPMQCSRPGSSVHGISQARIPEWVAIFFSRGSSCPTF